MDKYSEQIQQREVKQTLIEKLKMSVVNQQRVMIITETLDEETEQTIFSSSIITAIEDLDVTQDAVTIYMHHSSTEIAILTDKYEQEYDNDEDVYTLTCKGNYINISFLENTEDEMLEFSAA